MGAWLAANAWMGWLLLAAVLGVTELLTLDFTLLMLASGALAGGVVALVFPGLFWLQILVAVVVAVAMLALLRPTLLRRVRELPGYRSSLDAMIGSTGVATSAITVNDGEVKVAGQTWSARSVEGTIPVGTEVEVYRIDGAVAVVYPRNLALP